MPEFRVEWSILYEAKHQGEALQMAIADLETAIKYHEGATGFYVSNREDEEDKTLIDIEYHGTCDECGSLYLKADAHDHCTVEGTCPDHCTCQKSGG